VGDVLAYLLAAKDLLPGGTSLYEIGGTDVWACGDPSKECARHKGAATVPPTSDGQAERAGR
jgi:hypothetical protein